ncbi:type II toxin-antitoxin system HipA family toxin [Bdellovibrionota bacterium FG-2]
MKIEKGLKPVTLLNVHLELEGTSKRKVGMLAKKDRELLFEYDHEFLQSGLELSPFCLPLKSGVTVGDPSVFQGLMGVFEDSLPDGWGRLLLDRRIAQAGLSPASFGPLDRLAFVGSHGMGALVYEPEIEQITPTVVDLNQVALEIQGVLNHTDIKELDRLLALGGSPQGARPKALVQLSSDGKIVLYGAQAIQPGFVPYLVKFRSKGDDEHTGTLEYVYARMAALAGIDLPETRLLGRKKNRPGYFAIRRFDRDGGNKLHNHTLSGLLQAPHTYPALSYRELLLATRKLTRSEKCVSEMFRRACFNVFAKNRDDHARNFSFLMDANGNWRPSPAYDLTYSSGPGGEHMMLVADEGRNPTTQHLKALAHEVGLKHPGPIIEEVRAAVSQFEALAIEEKLPKKLRDTVGRALFVQ